MFRLFDVGFSILFPLVFLLVIGTFVVILVKGIREWGKNNASPRLRVPVQVISRRTSVSHSGGTNGMPMSSHTSYYVTFQVESGDRMELNIPAGKFGYIAEGDRGMLTFQGTRFLDFERTI